MGATIAALGSVDDAGESEPDAALAAKDAANTSDRIALCVRMMPNELRHSHRSPALAAMTISEFHKIVQLTSAVAVA